MEYYDPIPNKKKGEIWLKSAKADPEEVGCTYGIDLLNIDQAKHDSDYSK